MLNHSNTYEHAKSDITGCLTRGSRTKSLNRSVTNANGQNHHDFFTTRVFANHGLLQLLLLLTTLLTSIF